MTARILFDLSTLVRHRGTVTGIVRAQQELARYARAHRSDVIFTVYDPFSKRFRAVRREWIDAVVENDILVDPSLLWNPGEAPRRAVQRMPAFASQIYFWVTKFRRQFISELERLAMGPGPRRLPPFEWLVRKLTKKHEFELYLDADGNLRRRPSLSVLLDDTLTPAPDDIIVSAQADWYHIDIEALDDLKRRVGLRHAVLCYDIIPLLFPEWYERRDVEIFRRYYTRAFAIADRVIFTARSVERESRAYCQSIGIDLADTTVFGLGADIPAATHASTPLPAPLEQNRFAMFVSTIEPRKNHKLLLAVWRRLVADGVVDSADFKLVFVGRRGWKMEAFFQDLETNPEFGESIFHFTDVDDSTLRALYASAAFTLYPSIHEGYGLPPVESMLTGTPVIASNGGALAEVVGPAGLSLDPNDEEAWYREMRRMIEDEDYRRHWAERARSKKPVPWDVAAAAFFEAVTAPLESNAPQPVDSAV